MDAFQEVMADMKAYHGIIMDVTKDERIPVDIRLEIALKAREISRRNQPVAP